MRPATRAIHKAQPHDPQTGAVSFPIYQTSTFQQATPGVPPEFDGRSLSYARSENPSRTVLEAALAEVEDARHGLAFASGLAAVTAVMNTLSAGDQVIAPADLYGGSYRMFTKIYAKLGITFRFVDTTRIDAIEAAFTPSTKLLWLESPSNPLLNVTDLAAACTLARARGALSLVDNTFATPILQSPLKLGADVVLHSTTKYLNGHADVIGGALVCDDTELWRRFKFAQNACGLIPGPQDCFLVSRGLLTLPLRMERHVANALEVARFLESSPAVARVYYPGLVSHPGHETAKKQMRGFGAMVSFVLKADVAGTKRFLSALKLWTLAESLGAVQSLVCHPPTMTHASMEPEVRRAAGIDDGLVRLSVGLEDVQDLIEDLERAFHAAL